MNLFRPSRAADFDLLPNQYRIDQKLQMIRYVWMTILGMLIALLVSSTVAEVIKHRLEVKRRDKLIAEVFPIVMLRQQIFHQSSQQASQTELIEAVESAKPSDDLLQTLASIAEISQPNDKFIEIDRIQLRLPLEYKEQANATKQASVPSWAAGNLHISAFATSSSLARKWAKQIKQLDRVDQDGFKEDVPFQNVRSSDDDWEADRSTRQPVSVTARPLSETRLP